MMYLRAKRLIDIILSLLGLIILSPVFLILIIAIKLDSPGPVLFKQKRVGIHKNHFNILKFRTMQIDTPSDMPTHLLENPDQWITKVGKFLRKIKSLMDLYSRKIVAWELLDRLSVDGILSYIKKAKRNRFLLSPIIIHSDRGVQFLSNSYKEVIRNEFIRRYSGKANPWDNACIESFHALIKREWLNKGTLKT